MALDRALADNARYSMALLLRKALDSGARLPMTPEEFAASYDELDAGAAAPGTKAGVASMTMSGP